jgi:hypothetical protein
MPHIALRAIKVDVTKGGYRKLETRQPGDAVPEAARWRNPGVWIRRGDITDENGFIWKGGLNTGIQFGDQNVEQDGDDAIANGTASFKAMKKYAKDHGIRLQTPTADQLREAIAKFLAKKPEPEPPAAPPVEEPVPSDGADATDDPPVVDERQPEAEAPEATATPTIEIPTREEVLAAGYPEESVDAMIRRQEVLAAAAAAGRSPGDAVAEADAALTEAMKEIDSSDSEDDQPVTDLDETPQLEERQPETEPDMSAGAASGGYTEKDLEAMTKAMMVELALADFELILDAKMRKAEMIETIMEAQG